MGCFSPRALGWVAICVGSMVVACAKTDETQEEVVPTLAIAQVEILTENRQAGHPIEVRATLLSDVEVEDVGVTFYLEPVPTPALAQSGEEVDEDGNPVGSDGRPKKTVLDSVVEAVVPKSVESTETGFLLGRDPDTVRAPDVAFVSRSTLERAARFHGYFPGPPDLAVEVLSPSEQPAAWKSSVSRSVLHVTRSPLGVASVSPTTCADSDPKRAPVPWVEVAMAPPRAG